MPPSCVFSLTCLGPLARNHLMRSTCKILLHEYECRFYLALLCFSFPILHCWRHPPFLSHAAPPEKCLAWNPKGPLCQSLPDTSEKAAFCTQSYCRSSMLRISHSFKIHTASLNKDALNKWRGFDSTLFNKTVLTGTLHAAPLHRGYFSRTVFHCHTRWAFWSLSMEKQTFHNWSSAEFAKFSIGLFYIC